MTFTALEIEEEYVRMLNEGGRETVAGPSISSVTVPVVRQSVASLVEHPTRAGETVSRRAHNPETPGSTPGRAISSPAAATVGGAHGAGSSATSGQKSGANGAGDGPCACCTPAAPDSLSPSRRALGQALLEWGRKL